MRSLRFVRRHPIALLAVFAVAFVVWLWRDALPSAEPGVESVEIQPGQFRSRRPLPEPPDVSEVGALAGAEKGKLTPQVLSKLKPGMTRAEVEGLVGVPAAQDILPATVADGRVTYHTAYDADFAPPPTVRPIKMQPSRVPVPTRDPISRTVVTLEYDASKPGHPLLGVHYPDPLF